LGARDSHLPSQRDLATHFGVTESQIGEAMLGDQFFAPLSLDAPSSADSYGQTLGDELSDSGDDVETMLDCSVVLPLVDKLPARERDIVISTFWRDEAQASIGKRWGVSQMQVSRLLARTLRDLREAA